MAPLRILGVISSSICLWHVPVLCFVNKYFPVNTRLQAFIVLTLTAKISITSYRYVERSFLRIGRKIRVEAFNQHLIGDLESGKR
jgi:peptidoglycan/LPS O-acetylase OafA/YrhL